MTRLLVPTIALALLTPGVALGWGQCGHRVVGTLADERLDPAVQEQVNELLGGETLAMVSTWADEVRTDPRYHMSSWHYTSVPDGEAYTDNTRGRGEGKEDIVQAILLNAEILRDKEKSAKDRGIALRWIAHLVCDLHQPLHVGRSEDQGGNRIKCTWSTEFGGLPHLSGPSGLAGKIDALLDRAEALKNDATSQATAEALAEAVKLLKATQKQEVVAEANLHSIWDTFLIEMKGLDYREYARFLVAKRGTADEAGWSAFKADGVEKAVLDWTAESLAMRKEAYQKPPANKYGHYTYRDAKLPLIDQRLHQGGVRLARLLNVLLGE